MQFYRRMPLHGNCGARGDCLVSRYRRSSQGFLRGRDPVACGFCGQGYHGECAQQYLGYLEEGSPPACPRCRSDPANGLFESHLGEGEFAYTAACKASDVLKQRKLRRARRPDEIRVPIPKPANGVSDRQLFGTDDLREICLSKYKSEDYRVCELCKRHGDCAFAGRLVPEGERLNDVAPLLGRYSLLAADQHGRISQWFMVRGEFGQELEQARHFDLEAPARQIIPEPRRKGFAAVDAEQRLHLFYTTSSRHLARHPMAVDDVAAASIAPRSDLLLAALPDGSVQSYHLDNEHPEISWSTLWSKIWYEGYQEPVYSWQSSSAETDFEPKFSLTPLLFGTLKGAFYAMVVAVPVAIMGALYTAYFMAPAMRRIVKESLTLGELEGFIPVKKESDEDELASKVKKPKAAKEAEAEA